MNKLLQFPRPKKLHRIGLRCRDCHQGFAWRARQLLLDLGTAERRERGEEAPYGEFFVPAHVICPHCQAEDRYNLSPWQYLSVTFALFWYRWFPPGPKSWFQAVKMGTREGRIMHPLELRAWYEKQVAEQPRRADLRLRYANTLRTIGWDAEAIAQYRETLALAPRETEALINLAALLAQRGDQNEALNYLSVLANTRPKNKAQREMVVIAREVLTGNLRLDELEVGNPLVKYK